MASHKSSSSLSNSNYTSTSSLAPPPATAAQRQQRRMTSPSLPPPSSLNLPEPVYGHPTPHRPPSPLRNGFSHDSDEDEDEDEDDDDGEDNGTWGRRPHSPSSSVSQFATTFAQRVGSLVHNMSPRSAGSGLPTDAELEAEAERERDRSRREAERILTQEAEERRLVEERVLAMMNSNQGSPRSLPVPTRAQTLPNPPSPANSQKESAPSWWTAAKNRLTPTKDKDSLTPAQQVIQETKAKDKADKKNGKGKEKEWPASSQGKYSDPAFLNLAIPAAAPRRPVPTSPSSPTPSRPVLPNAPPVLTPSPMRSGDGGGASSPSREAPPLYAQFSSQGTLDVPGTLLVIAKRFEKLEKWTVGHVRALEERMGDVERWLVDKEKEKEESVSSETRDQNGSNGEVGNEINEMREEVTELQGRVGELGREMAKLVTAPSNLSSAPSRQTAPISVAPQTTSSIAVHSRSPSVSSSGFMPTTTTPRVASSTARSSTSPPLQSSTQPLSARTRLPYPTGDYATPPDTVVLSQGFFSPTNSPPSSITSATRARSISGLPFTTPTSQSAAPGLPSATSPPARVRSPSGLPAPKTGSPRPSSVSPTPRKRYTVALGAPIVDPLERSGDQRERSKTPVSFSQPQSSISTAFFSSSPVDGDVLDNSLTDKYDFQDETIGKSAGRLSSPNTNHTDNRESPSPSPGTSPSNPRLRPQSLYGQPSLQSLGSSSPVAPLRPRLRSRSTIGLGISDGAPTTPLTGKFVDPLVLRKQELKETAQGNGVKLLPGKGKVPVGQLVAFFDGDKKIE